MEISLGSLSFFLSDVSLAIRFFVSFFLFLFSDVSLACIIVFSLLYLFIYKWIIPLSLACTVIFLCLLKKEKFITHRSNQLSSIHSQILSIVHVICVGMNAMHPRSFIHKSQINHACIARNILLSTVGWTCAQWYYLLCR